MKIKKFSLEVGNRIFKALSEEARLRIMFLLFNKKSMCITDLEFVLDYTQAKTSRHITYLKNAGLIYSKKKDQWVFYSVREEFHEIIEQIFKFLEKDQTLLHDLEIYETLYSNRELAINKVESRSKNYYGSTFQ